MGYKYTSWDKANIQRYFDYKGQRYGRETQVLFTKDFYCRHAGKHLLSLHNPSPSTFYCIRFDGNKIIWSFNDCIVDDFVLERDIKAIVKPVSYVKITDKDKIRMKKEKGLTWEYIWPGTLLYIFCMIFITVFNERVWGWIAATIIYNNYCYEQLSR